MAEFFDPEAPVQTVTHGSVTFNLPINYKKDDLFGLYFSADAAKVRAQMPSDKLYPILLPNGRAIVAVFAFNYIETDIGTYGEVAVALPAVYGKKPASGSLAALLEARYPGFGVLVYHLPVTKETARDAGRGQWGYTKFIADMDFSFTPDYSRCQMYEENQLILDLKVARRGHCLRDKNPLITYSVLNGQLIKTTVAQQGIRCLSIRTNGSGMKLGDHPVSHSIRDLGIAERPMMACYYPERAGILPAGQVIENAVRPLDGYPGKTRSARHRVVYLP